MTISCAGWDWPLSHPDSGHFAEMRNAGDAWTWDQRAPFDLRLRRVCECLLPDRQAERGEYDFEDRK
jgi:hypothetical protein